MKILFLTQYFPPEVGAPQNRIYELARLLVRRGHEVTVLTGMPNYPAYETFEGYKGKLIHKEEMEGMKIVRTWLYVTKNTGFIPRLMNYFSFTFSSVLLGSGLVGRHDIVFTESPPLFLGASGYILSKLKRAKFIFNVSDLWPESAVKLGVLNSRSLIKLSTWLEEFSYRKSSLITGQTQGIIDDIERRGFKNTFLLTNGTDTNFFSRMNRSEELRKEWNIPDKFAVVYAGIIGIAQGLDIILEAANLVRDHEGIQFLLVGEGPEKKRLVEKAEKMGLSNISFIPLQAKKDMPRIIASMDATIVPLKRLELFKGALPSKMFEALASELPIILAVEGEAQKLIERSGGGICVEPENAKEVAEAVLKLANDPELAKNIGRNGRRFVKEYYDREVIVQRLEEKLIELLKRGV
ncbi:glycosyltransferase family 4 protein [Tepidibacillus marianensis]|uniref:glycosyltransferase family 4 protein n=1 Tax=Tepidibacillus marianensis TaxID=3131995 RepID=UPI0030D1EE2D